MWIIVTGTENQHSDSTINVDSITRNRRRANYMVFEIEIVESRIMLSYTVLMGKNKT